MIATNVEPGEAAELVEYAADFLYKIVGVARQFIAIGTKLQQRIGDNDR